MGYDDLKVVEARRLVERISTGLPHGATIEDVLVTAELVDAMVQLVRGEAMGEPVSSGVRIGVVGAGAMGASHVETLARWVPGARLVQVYDADQVRAKEVA